MSDDRLRALERAAQADPTDATAGHALAGALALAGERRRALLEHARLARLGSSESRATLDAWSPRPHAAATVAPRPALGARVRTRAVALPGAPLAARPVASDDHLLLPTRTRLVALAPGDLAERWSAPGQAWPLALRGDDVLHAGGPGLLLRDGGTGEVLGEVPIAGRVVALSTWSDRALVVHDAPGLRRVSAVDVGARPGRQLWSREWPAGALTLALLARQRAALLAVDRAEVVEVETGRTSAALALVPPRPRGARWERARAGDPRGVIVEEVTPDLALGPARCLLGERDLGRLEPRWRLERTAETMDLALGPGVLLLRRAGPGGAEVEVVDRATGEARFVPDLPPHLGFVWAEGAAYLLEAGSGAGALSLHDPRTLARAARHELAVGPDLVDADALPFADAVVVSLAHRDRTLIVRLETDG
ncbi:MAG: hypothetical protein M9894_10235 [Planctomycetes bacterium]|nr:hypothetical protein [Planctomycetota bacterium]